MEDTTGVTDSVIEEVTLLDILAESSESIFVAVDARVAPALLLLPPPNSPARPEFFSASFSPATIS